MREGIGSTMMYNIIAIFIVVVFAILAGTMSYFKAFKANNKIVSILEKYEGYNDVAIDEIRNGLASIGYRQIDGISCRTRQDTKVYEQDPYFTYCVYLKCDERDPYKYKYGVVTYIEIDFPVISSFVKLPLYTETTSLHLMGHGQCTLN